MRHAVILAGGSGQRLWPASRSSRPKQFLPLGARPGESLLAATWRRIAPVVAPDRIAVVTASAQAAEVRAHLPELAPHGLIGEPLGRNTAAALGLAALHLTHRDPDAIMAVLPADHHITDEAGFARVATTAFALAEAHDVIVTVGIVPTRAETGFGYMRIGERFGEDARVVERFVEKPDAATAAQYLAGGDHLWNSGMYFVRARRLLRDIAAFMPATHDALAVIQRALEHGDDAAVRAAEAVYPGLPNVSIDHGVMERASVVITVPGDFGWNDVGSWAALADYRPRDEHGNVTEGTVIVHDARDNVVVADPGTAVAVIGVEGLVVVKAGNAILVVPRERAQDVRAAVAALKARKLDDYL